MNVKQIMRGLLTPLLSAALTVAMTVLLAVGAANASSPPVGFPIATTTGNELAVSAAFDGANYLVAVQGDATAGDSITAQMVSPTGAQVGQRIGVGRNGVFPIVAFDGDNYLLVWKDAPGEFIYGQFISKAGTLVGTPFAISSGQIAGNGLVGGIAFDGTNYLVLWCNGITQFPDGDNWTYAVTGRLVSPTGALVGNEIVLGQAVGTANIPSLAFDGVNYLAVWVQGNAASTGMGNSGKDIYGRFVAKSGQPVGNAFAIDLNTSPSDNPTDVAFDGSRYLVLFSNADPSNAPSDNWHWSLYARFVDTSGTVAPTRITISNADGNQLFPKAVYGGGDYLITWNHGLGTLTSSTKGRFLGGSGSFTSPQFNIFSATGDGRTPWSAGSGGFHGDRFLILANWGTLGAESQELNIFATADVFGTFLARNTGISSISPSAAAFGAGGWTGTIAVTAGGAWGANSNSDWIAITSGNGASGNGTVGYTVSVNATGAGRSGSITIGNQNFIVRQGKGDLADNLNPSAWSHGYINAIYTMGITTGCGNNSYCPADFVTREQMAAFIIRSLLGENFTYSATPYFNDVPANGWSFKYVQKLKDLGITAVSGSYDAAGFVTREQMAAFIVRATLGETFSYTTTPYFSDVPVGGWSFKYVQKLKDLGITTVSGAYGAGANVTREQMAAFLARAFLAVSP